MWSPDWDSAASIAHAAESAVSCLVYPVPSNCDMLPLPSIMRVTAIRDLPSCDCSYFLNTSVRWLRACITALMLSLPDLLCCWYLLTSPFLSLSMRCLIRWLIILSVLVGWYVVASIAVWLSVGAVLVVSVWSIFCASCLTFSAAVLSMWDWFLISWSRTLLVSVLVLLVALGFAVFCCWIASRICWVSSRASACFCLRCFLSCGVSSCSSSSSWFCVFALFPYGWLYWLALWGLFGVRSLVLLLP